MKARSTGKLACFAMAVAWLAGTVILPRDAQVDESWTVIDVDAYLGHEHGVDGFGEYFTIYEGLVAHRDGHKIVLVYIRWPDKMSRIVPGDRINILSDLSKLEKNRWGYSLADVSLSVVQSKPEF